MLKISIADKTEKVTTLRLEGRVIGPWVTELRTACEEAFSQGQIVSLDVAEVTFMDREAVALLRKMNGHVITLVNCPPLLTEQLKDDRT
ncbi:MAG: STAS domain-containing protein [Acidobacteriia bacterium]|nr:STAS domain-containing protein [Terriglobia bacterium]